MFAASGPAAQQAAPPDPDKPPPPEKIEPGESCINSDCHQTMGKKKFLHGPINFGKCEPCHTAIGDLHKFVNRPTGRDLCLKCHEIPPPKAVQHKPFTEDCSLCHVQHESDERYFVQGGTSVQGCVRQGCHEEFPRDHEFKHVSVEEGGCLVCHTSHQSDHEKLLTHDRGDLCLLCHTDFPHRLEGAVSSHTPNLKQSCTLCHTPHGGESEYLVPADEKEFCRGCHEIILDQVEDLQHPHKTMTAEKKCRECHEPHVSARNHLLAQPVMDLCLSCHDKPVEMEGRTLSNIAKQIEGSKYVHGPIRQKNCSACHGAHGTNIANILLKPFPKDIYAPHERGAYDSCFDCHDRNFVEMERTTLTGFRNGDQNLHYLHVIEKEKGRSCRICHHEHASNQPKHIRSQIKFGQWDMPLEYAMTETGGGCLTSCHPPFRYDQVVPFENNVANAEPIPKSQRVAGRTRPSRIKVSLPPDGTDANRISPIASIALRAGETAPMISLRDSGGAAYRLDGQTTPTLLLFLNPADSFTSLSLSSFHRVFGENPEVTGKIRRWIVLPRNLRKSDIRKIDSLAGKKWRVLLDAEGKVFPAYRIVATPTAVLLEKTRRIRAVHAGFGYDMARNFQDELNRLFNRKVTERKVAVEKMTSTQLILQMARRLAARGLWESSLMFYLQVKDKGELPAIGEVELAEVYLEMEQPGKTVEVLEGAQVGPEDQPRVDLLRKRALEIKAGVSEEAKPPPVTR